MAIASINASRRPDSAIRKYFASPCTQLVFSCAIVVSSRAYTIETWWGILRLMFSTIDTNETLSLSF